VTIEPLGSFRIRGLFGTGSGATKTTTDYLRGTDGLPNALPFSGLGAAKPALRFYADAAAATRSVSAATACSTALGMFGRNVVVLRLLLSPLYAVPRIPELIRRRQVANDFAAVIGGRATIDTGHT
jgi:hypothetical protein